MWIPKILVDQFSFNKEDMIRLRTENELLKSQLSKSEIMADWLRMRTNSLEAERGLLMEKAYNVRIPIPEMVRTQTVNPTMPIIDEAIFEGIPFTPEGDKLAEKLGLS